jgi:ATP-dependent Clp protease ATP-binding subunit ClpA
MRLFRQRSKPPLVRYADRYFGLGAREARSLGQHYIGSEHVLLALTRDSNGTVATTLGRLGVEPNRVEEQVRRRAGSPPPAAIDRQALAALGIDLDAVRERLEHTFGEGALEETRSGCMRVEPCLKRVLADAVERAGGAPLSDEHLLLGMLTISDSNAARMLTEWGVTLEQTQAALNQTS